jgi:hypothetical protein
MLSIVAHELRGRGAETLRSRVSRDEETRPS